MRGHLPMALSDLTGATIGHTVYLVGGWNGTSPQPTVWSTTDGTHFTKVATLPAGVRYPAVAAVGSNLVVAGGELASSTETTRVSLVDTTSGHVSSLAQLPEPIGHAMAFTSGGIVYVAGGRDDVGTALDTVIAIDPSSGKLTAAPKMPTALSDSAVATTADGPTVLIGGAGLAATRTVLQTQTISTSSIAAPSAETLKDPPISTPFVQDLSPGGGPAPVRRQAPDRRPRQQPVAGPQPERQRHVDVPVAEAPRSPRALLLPRRRLLGARRPRDPRATRKRTTSWPRSRTRAGRRCGRTVTRGSAGPRPDTSHQPDDLYPYPGGGLVVADAKNCRVLFFDPAGNPSGQVGQTGNCTPGLPKTVGYPNGATPMPNGDLLVSEINGARVSRLRANKTVDWTTTRARPPHAVGPAADDRRLEHSSSTTHTRER